MCGRYAFDDINEIFEARKILEEIASRLGNDAANSVKTGEICPNDTAAVIAQYENGFKADVMSWGYPMRDSTRIIINARSESVFNLSMFNKSLKNKRCLIPCTGFFEWKRAGNSKTKYKIKLYGDDIFYLAGVYDCFSKAEEKKNRFVILTTAPDVYMKEIHDRMPLIVSKANMNEWLSGVINEKKISRITGMTGKLAIDAV